MGEQYEKGKIFHRKKADGDGNNVGNSFYSYDARICDPDNTGISEIRLFRPSGTYFGVCALTLLGSGDRTA